MNVLDLALKHVKLRRVSGTKGGEYQGPCPACGGEDRFHVWPEQNDRSGSYWCRGCGSGGDNIQFLRDFEGYSFQGACERLNITIPDRPRPGPGGASRAPVPGFVPAEHTAPADRWQEKAEKLVTWAAEHLAKNTDVLAWLSERGIDRAAVDQYRLGWNPGEEGRDIFRARKAWGLPDIRKENGRLRSLWIPVGLIIPAVIDGAIVRIRIRRPEGEPRYYVIPGSSSHVMLLEEGRRAFVIVESELDAIAVAAGNTLAGAVSVGTSHGKPDAYAHEILRRCLQILVALDFDKAGRDAWAWWPEQFEHCDRWPVPQGKDPGDAVRMGTDFDMWIKAGLPPVLTMNMDRAPSVDLLLAVAAPPEAPPEAPRELPEAVRELYGLLRQNPAVMIINSAERFTVLRQGKYVGGRINELVFQVPEVREYIFRHPAEEITGDNFIQGRDIHV